MHNLSILYYYPNVSWQSAHTHFFLSVDVLCSKISARIWVQVHDLPWSCLNSAWTNRLLSHVGYVDTIDNYGQGLPLQPFLRARVIIDLSQPLVPGCFVPLVGNRVSWVYVRYEGFYKSVRNAAVSDTT